MWFDEFKQIIKKNNKIISKSLTEKNFLNKNKIQLWNDFIDNTKHLSKFTYSQRVKILELGYFNTLPKCYCGNDVSWLDNKLSKYCSRSCAASSIARKQKISNTKQKQNHVVINDKRKNTMIEKYGVEYNSQREEIKNILKKSKLKKEIEDLLVNYNWLNTEYNEKRRTASDIADELGCFYGTVIDYCRKHNFKIRRQTNYSVVETKLFKYVKSLYPETLQGDWPENLGFEIDVYIPSLKFGFEMDGLYHHSKEDVKGRHLMKTVSALEKGISLMHFTDEEYNTKTEIVQSMIKNKLKLSENKIYARKCIVKEVSSKESKVFFNKNHISGYSNAKISYGLYYANELVFCISFGKSRFNKKYDWEIIRLASKIDTSITGGISKIINHFRKLHIGSILTYVDRRFGEGTGFEKLGFKFQYSTKSGYFWTDGNISVSRYKCQRQQLMKWLTSYNSNKTESQNMKAAGYKQFWDCGNNVFVLE